MVGAGQANDDQHLLHSRAVVEPPLADAGVPMQLCRVLCPPSRREERPRHRGHHHREQEEHAVEIHRGKA